MENESSVLQKLKIDQKQSYPHEIIFPTSKNEFASDECPKKGKNHNLPSVGKKPFSKKSLVGEKSFKNPYVPVPSIISQKNQSHTTFGKKKMSR